MRIPLVGRKRQYEISPFRRACRKTKMVKKVKKNTQNLIKIRKPVLFVEIFKVGFYKRFLSCFSLLPKKINGGKYNFAKTSQKKALH